MGEYRLNSIDVAGILKKKFEREEYKNLLKLRIYDKGTICLVFDFNFNNHIISIDLVPQKEGVEFQLFQRSPETNFLDQKLSEQGANYLKSDNGRFVHKYPKEWTLVDIIEDTKKRLEAINRLND